MTIVATGSKVSRQNALIVLVMCLAFGSYFVYDGYVSEPYQRRHVDWEIQQSDLKNPVEFAVRLKMAADPIAAHLFSKLSPAGKALIDNMNPAAVADSQEFLDQFIAELNSLMERTDLFSGAPDFEMRPQSRQLLNLEEKHKEDVVILNHMLLIDAFPRYFVKETWRDGKPTANLMFNRYWGPAVCIIASLYFLISLIRIRSYRIKADSTGLEFNNGIKIPYIAITQIDNREFDKKGRFTIVYQDNGVEKTQTISRSKYDNLKAVLDEIVKQTGAAPTDDAQPSTDNPKQ